jgi:hypothetical protein
MLREYVSFLLLLSQITEALEQPKFIILLLWWAEALNEAQLAEVKVQLACVPPGGSGGSRGSRVLSLPFLEFVCIPWLLALIQLSLCLYASDSLMPSLRSFCEHWALLDKAASSLQLTRLIIPEKSHFPWTVQGSENRHLWGLAHSQSISFCGECVTEKSNRQLCPEWWMKYNVVLNESQKQLLTTFRKQSGFDINSKEYYFNILLWLNIILGQKCETLFSFMKYNYILHKIWFFKF